MLGMLERFDVKSIFPSSEATGLHLLLEVMKRAMADRAHWLGDSDFAKVPKGLLDTEYLAKRAADIDLEKSVLVMSHGVPPRADSDWFGKKHTTHLTTADDEGNLVALTQTVNTSFGCKMIVPGTGVVLNNEMDDFSIAPGVRNAFGLVGSAANAVAAGKRPLSSMSPTIVLDGQGNPIMTCGAAGGPKIITAVLQTVIRVLDLEQSIGDAIGAGRVHHQWSPDQAICENAIPDEVANALAARGHSIQRIRAAAVAQGISISTDGVLTAASDPRVPSAALALNNDGLSARSGFASIFVDVWSELLRQRLLELVKQVLTVMRTRGRLWVILNTERIRRSMTHTRDRIVVQVSMRYPETGWQRCLFDGKAMILASDFNLARIDIEDRLVGSAMSKFHFECLGTASQTQQLMSEADAEDWSLSD